VSNPSGIGNNLNLQSNQVQSHAEWVGTKVAEAREQGIREGLDNQTAAQIIAGLYQECESLQRAMDQLVYETQELLSKGTDGE
jgi:hypothetical protein